MADESIMVSFPAATISSLPRSTSSRRDVDVARQAAAGFGCMAALEVEKYLMNQKA